jgi:hypothetical protein
MPDETDTTAPSQGGSSPSPLFGVLMLSCAVKSNKGKRCQNPPSRVVKIDGGDEIMLCPRCYENACAGVYGDVSVIPVREISPPNVTLSDCGTKPKY